MPDRDDFPRCGGGDHHPQCEYYKPAVNRITDEAMMACLNGNAPTKGMEVPENFGCILHSALEPDA